MVLGGLSIGVLGPLQVVAGGVPVKVGGIKQRTVLAMLALRANREVSRDALIEAVWADDPPSRPAVVLQVYVANLRRILRSADPDPGPGPGTVSGEEWIVSHPGGYVLRLGPDELDLLDLRRSIWMGEACAQLADLFGVAKALRHAVELIRGDPFPDLAEVGGCRAEVAEVEEVRLRLVEDLMEVDLTLGRHAVALTEAQVLVAKHPFRERVWASLVLGLYRSDRQADALAACRRARRLFREELGVDPGEELQQLERAVLRHDPVLRSPVAARERRRLGRPDNLPAAVTALVGREDEVAEVVSLLTGADTRLVTVTGHGGIGKTRFALAVALRLRGEMTDGVCWVDLADVADVDQVPVAAAAALGVGDRPGSDPVDTASAFLHDRQMLLVLDNFEQVEMAWPLVVQLLGGAAHLRILVTSRWPLQVRGETEFELPPLRLPPAGSSVPLPELQRVEAVELFVSRGRAVRRGFAVDMHNAGAVTRICRRLDGLPLALELAAAQLGRHSPASLLDLLDRGVDRLPASIRDLPNRQQTLHATIAWSCQLLDSPVRDLFEQLGVFAGAPTLDAIQAVCSPGRGSAAVAGLVATLVDHNLLRCERDPSETPRYSMLQSIREFARHAFAARPDAATLRRRHGQYFLDVGEAQGPLLFGSAQVSALNRLQAEGPDLRGALVWAAGDDGSLEVTYRLVGCLWHFWELNGDVVEAGRIAETVIGRMSEEPGQIPGPAMSGAATLCWLRGRTNEATTLHRRALAAFQDEGHDEGISWSLVCLAVQAIEQDRPSEAITLAERALSTPGASHRTQACACVALGGIAVYQAQHERAETWHRRSVELARTSGDQWLLGIALLNLADCAEQARSYDTAATLLRDALTTSHDTGGGILRTACLEAFAAVQLGRGQPEHAIRLLAAAATYRADTALPLNHQERQRIDSVLADARADVDPIRFAVLWATGTSLTLTEAVEESLNAIP